MVDKKWRDDLDLLVEKNLNELIKETKEFDYAISKANNKSKAQLWVALALINSKLNKILVQENKTKKKLSKDELNSIVKALESM